MIDFFMRYADEAAAKADAILLSEDAGLTPSKEWRRSNVIPDVKAWRPSQDVYSGSPPTFDHHVYLSGWYALVSTKGPNQTLMNAAALAFALDRDAANAGRPFVVKNNIGPVIQDIGVSPIFAGSNYPIGGYPAPDSPPV